MTKQTDSKTYEMDLTDDEYRMLVTAVAKLRDHYSLAHANALVDDEKAIGRYWETERNHAFGAETRVLGARPKPRAA